MYSTPLNTVITGPTCQSLTKLSFVVLYYILKNEKKTSFRARLLASLSRPDAVVPRRRQQAVGELAASPHRQQATGELAAPSRLRASMLAAGRGRGRRAPTPQHWQHPSMPPRAVGHGPRLHAGRYELTAVSGSGCRVALLSRLDPP